MLDTTRAVETPEGVTLDLRIAGPGPRAMAWAIDAAIRGVGYAIIALVLMTMGRLGLGLFFVILFLVEWFYPVCFEVLASGSTPGKRALGIRVLAADGSPVGFRASFTRSLLMVVDFLPWGYATGLMAMFLSRNFQRVGDLAADTLVVYRNQAIPWRQREDIEPLPPDRPLNLDEQRAIVAFSERRATLTRERAWELADLAEPLTGARGEEGLIRLRAMAAALRGQG